MPAPRGSPAGPNQWFCGAPVVRALMPAYVVPLTVCASTSCRNGILLETTAAVRWWDMLSSRSSTERSCPSARRWIQQKRTRRRKLPVGSCGLLCRLLPLQQGTQTQASCCNRLQTLSICMVYKASIGVRHHVYMHLYSMGHTEWMCVAGTHHHTQSPHRRAQTPQLSPA